MTQPRDPTDLPALERDKQQAEQEELRVKLARQGDVMWLMSHKPGRRIVWAWLDDAGVFRTSFTGNSETFFREGMRNMGLKLLNEIHEVCPDLYAKMAEEHRARAEPKKD